MVRAGLDKNSVVERAAQLANKMGFEKIALKVLADSFNHLIRTFRAFLEGFSLLVNNKAFGHPLTSRPFLSGDAYAEYAPCRQLFPYIACFWESDNRDGERSVQDVLVIPDTCHQARQQQLLQFVFIFVQCALIISPLLVMI